MKKEFFDEIMKDVKDENIFDFKDKVKQNIQNHVDMVGKEFINSGDAFKNFVNSDRFNESVGLEDVATEMYKKFKDPKTKTDLIKKELIKMKYSLKDISSIMKMVDKL